MGKWWRIWAKSLGEKVGETDKQANTIAVIRTIWWFTHMLTCLFIILKFWESLSKKYTTQTKLGIRTFCVYKNVDRVTISSNLFHLHIICII